MNVKQFQNNICFKENINAYFVNNKSYVYNKPKLKLCKNEKKTVYKD